MRLLSFCIKSLLFIVVWPLAWTNGCVAQNPHDSITTHLSSLPPDSALTLCISNARSSPPEIAAIYVREGKALAKKLDDTVGLAKIYSEEAILENIHGRPLEGAQLFGVVDSIYRVLGDTMARAGALTNAGLSYFHAGMYDLALEKYFEADGIYSERIPGTPYSRLLNNLAMTLKHLERPDEAKKYYLKSIVIKESLRDSAGIAHTWHNLALLLSEQGAIRESVAAFDTAIAIYRMLDMPDDEASSSVALGKVLMDAGQIERAQDYLQSGYLYFQKSAPGSHEFVLAAGEMAALSRQLGQWEQAERYVDEALAYTGLDQWRERVQLLDHKAEISSQIGKPVIAYAALREAYALKDSMFAAQRLSLMEEMQTKFSVREKENALRIATVELENQERISALYRTGLIAAVIIALVIAALGVFLYRSRQEIARNQKVIAQALYDKEVLLREIHHRVKNNLQIISSLLGMQSYQSRDPNVSDAMREGQNRVRAMALIHQGLYQQDNVIAVDAQEYIRRLSDSLKTAYRASSDRISIETSVDPMRLDVDIMIPIGLILNELVTNALKYAFPGETKGSIRIGLRKTDNAVELSVHDDGIGMREVPKDGHSMGYTLVQDFCAKLKADLRIQSERGTEIVVRIPE